MEEKKCFFAEHEENQRGVSVSCLVFFSYFH